MVKPEHAGFSAFDMSNGITYVGKVADVGLLDTLVKGVAMLPTRNLICDPEDWVINTSRIYVENLKKFYADANSLGRLVDRVTLTHAAISAYYQLD